MHLGDVSHPGAKIPRLLPANISVNAEAHLGIFADIGHILPGQVAVSYQNDMSLVKAHASHAAHHNAYHKVL